MGQVLCHKCNSEMEELEEDYESMTEGQMADYDAGLWRTFWCPLCKISEFIEEPFSFHTIHDEDKCFEMSDRILLDFQLNIEHEEAIALRPRDKHAKENIIRGDFNEYLARKSYESKGYTVIKLVNQIPKGNNVASYEFNDNEIHAYCNFSKLKGLYKFLKNQPVAGVSDFLCIKNKEFFFIECKCNPNKLKPTQINFIKKCKKEKYLIKIFSTPIDLVINYNPSSVYNLF